MDDDTSNVLKSTSSVAKDCFDAHVYIGPKINPALAGFVQIGLLVKSAIEANEPDKSDPVMSEIEGIAKTLDQVDEKMKANFDALKSLVAQYSFFNDVPMVSSLLARYTWEVCKRPTRASLDKLRKKYEMFPPVKYARRLNHQLNKATTNPLKILTSSDPSKAKETLEQWNKNFEGTFLQLLLVESFAFHFFNNAHRYRLNMFHKEYLIFTGRLKKWYDEYKIDYSNWESAVEQIVWNVFNNDHEGSVSSKASKIKEDLELIATMDMFYVLIFPNSIRSVIYEHLKNQTKVIDQKGCTVIVYRSLQAYKEAPSVLLRSFNAVRNEFNHTYESSLQGSSWITTYMLSNSAHNRWRIGSCGLFVAVDATSDKVGVAWTGKDKHRNGCGFRVDGQLEHKDKSKSPYIIFSCYK